MKVLYCHQHFSTRAGATGTRSYEMAQRLIARGHQVTMICGSYAAGASGLSGEFVRGRRAGTVDGIQVIEFELPYGNHDSLLRRTLTFCRFAGRSVLQAMTRDYDLIFATSTPLTAGVPGLCAHYLRRKPFVFEVRDLCPELPRAMGVISNPLILAAMSALEWLSYRAARQCIGLSPGIKQGICRRGVREPNVAMIPNGCDLDLFANAPAQPVPGVRSDEFVAVFSGTHGRANGLDALLDCAALLRDRGRTDIKLVMIGDGARKAPLVARATTDQLHQCVFVDPIAKQALAGVLKSANIGLQILANIPAFYYGTSPNKFFDYIAAGLPVVINYPGWLAERVEQSSCGIAVEPENPAALADALEYLADHRDAAKTMGENARRLAEQEFNRDQLGDQFVAVLEKTIAPKPPLNSNTQ